MTIGQQVKKIRESKGIKQGFIAKKLGVTHSYYNLLENGKHQFTKKKLDAVCKLLDIKHDL